MIAYGNTGTTYTLDKQLAAGGEGAVWTVQGAANMVAKVYHQEKISSDPELEHKIRYMVSNPPDKSILDQIAWPMDILRGGNGQFMGFIMPRLDTDTDLKKIYPYPPKKDMPVTVEQKLIIAINICIVISEVHKAGYIFGDFNPMNIGINLKNGHVAFFDADSYHFTDSQSGHTYRCGVGADGYIAPELIQHCHSNHADFLGAPLPTFTRETDNFALAIHIFKLLMNGYTPFNGIKECESASQSSPGTGNIAIERDNYCFKAGNKPQSPATPDIASLSPDIQYLFKKTFEGGVKDPQNRATAEEWKDALIEYKDQLTQCKRNPAHYYYVNNSKCPYCEAYNKYQQSISGVTQTYGTGSSGNSQVSFSNPINVPPTTQTSNYNAYQGGHQKNAAKSASQNTLLRVLLWIFFFPIMLGIKVWKSHMNVLIKLIVTCLIVSATGSVMTSCTSILTHVVSGGSSGPKSSDVVEGGLRFEKRNDAYVVSADPDSISTLSGEVQIPASCKDRPVVAIKENGFAGCVNITSVTVPDTVINIGKGAFAGCTSLTDMTLPFVGKSEDAIGTEAVFGYIFGFEESLADQVPDIEHSTDVIDSGYSLVNEEPPERVGYIWQCSVYYHINWDYSLTYYFYEIPDSLRNITITKQGTVPAYAFNGCAFLENISFTAEMKKNSFIGTGAFQNCKSWTPGIEGVLVVPDNCIAIGDYAYANCEKIVGAIVSDYVRKIGAGAFNGCTSLTDMTLPFVGKSEDAIGTEAVFGYIFGFEESLADQVPDIEHSTDVIEYGSSLVNVAPAARTGYVWQCSVYYHINWDYSLTYYFFEIPNSLQNVTIAKQKNLPPYAFNGCSGLTNLTLPEGYSVNSFSFQNCPAVISTQ